MRFKNVPLAIGTEGVTNLSNGVTLSISSSELEEGQCIGQGSSAVVHAGRHVPTNTWVAIKSINIYFKDRRRQLQSDLMALDGFDCPYLIKYYGAYFNEDRVKLVMELMDLRSARTIIECLGGTLMPEAVLCTVAHGILCGLEYLHVAKNVCHRDIKPDNILFNTSGQIKLSDFGICKTLDSDAKCHSFVGTIKYMSPERVKKSEYGCPGDVWSLGLTLFELATGVFPYPNTDNIIVQLENFDQVPPQLPANGNHSAELIHFVDCCLKIDPAQRATVPQLLTHSWFSNFQPVDVAAWLQQLYAVSNYLS